jgi:paraquat-inducible protein A
MPQGRGVGETGMSAAFITAAEAGLLSCDTCHFVCRPAEAARAARCPRCEAPVHSRMPASLARTWAYLVACYLLYLPANLLPIMDTSSLFADQSDTIMSGIRYLWNSGSWATAVVVFVASIVQPVLKLSILTYIAICVQRGRVRNPLRQARLYRFVHVIGRWSMLDIYVVTLLVALVQSPTLAEIEAGPAAIAYGALVAFTMLASQSFDPRLIWDAARSPRRARDAHG